MKIPFQALTGRLSRALVVGLIWRGWQIAAVPFGLYLVTLFFTPETQGYYYTFSSLAALQSFFELGLFIVVLNVAAHEWSSLSLDQNGAIVGDREALSRLISFGRMIFRYYSIAAALFCLIVSLVGIGFFSRRVNAAFEWKGPWCGFILFVSLNLLAAPFCSLLEGCGQIVQVYRMRLWQSMLSTVCGWLVIARGGGLWALTVVAGVQAASVLYFLLVRYRVFFHSFRQPPTGSRLSWVKDVWPMQWRIASSGVVNYFAGSLFTPVMFQSQGPAVAGQMGMTMQLAGGIQSVALTLLEVRVPEYGKLVARRAFDELNRLWLKTRMLSLATYLSGASLLFVAVILARSWEIPAAARVLSPLALGGFLVAGAMVNIIQSFAAYLRAFKQEPMLAMSVSTSLLSGCGVLLLGPLIGPIGVAWWYCFTMVLGVGWLYFIWETNSKKWTKAQV